MSNFQQWNVEEPWLNTRCSLGEGPFYEKDNNVIRFIDIKKKQIHSVPLDKGTESIKTIQLDEVIGVTANIAGVDPSDRILIAIKSGLAILDRKTGSYELIKKFPQNERLRANDGGSDPHGRFWVGTMTDFPYGDCQPEGSLYRFDGTKNHEEILKDLIIPNSVGWSPDEKTLYFTHTTAGEVLALDYSPATGAVSNQRVFYKHKGDGGPDGFRVDVEGNIWHAFYGESRVLKISPDGEVVGQINLPTRNITCVQFAGTELVITTASDEDSGDERSQLLGGAVFRVDVGVEGLDLYDFKLD